MTTQKYWRRVAIAAPLVLWVLQLGTLARGATAPIEINLGYGKIKAMKAKSDPGNANDDGITGSFMVTKKGADNMPLTLQQLEKMLGQDHLNWFQKVTDQQPAESVPPGVTIPFIDPPNGGLPINVDPTWADSRPWYFDEFVPNPVPMGRNVVNDFQLSNNAAGSTLDYFDFPGGHPKNTTISFSTFLVSDFGNMTYDILGKGYSWTTTFPDDSGVGKITDITKGVDFTMEFQNEIRDEFGWRRARGPDNSQSNNQNPLWKVREKGPAGAVINVQPTNNGFPIENADGSIVQYSKSVPAGDNGVDFLIPGIVNGKKVTDASQRTGKGRDPGTLYFSVFDEAMLMIEDSLSSWLWDNGYRVGSGDGLFMPDFFPDPSSGFEEVFYGVDMDQLLSAGESFVQNSVFDQTFSVGSLSALLPSYVFSSTPLEYVPGQGWVGTPLDPTTQLSYVAFHEVLSIPEPSAFTLMVLTCALWRLQKSQRGRRGAPISARL